MKLIIGGAFQGKLAYASAAAEIAPEEFADGAVCGFEVLDTCRGMNHFHEYVRRYLAEGRSVEELPERIVQKNRKSCWWPMSWAAGSYPWIPLNGSFGRPLGVFAAVWPRRRKKYTG